jgi:hypothetical protein
MEYKDFLMPESPWILNRHRTFSGVARTITSVDVKATDIRRKMVLGFGLFLEALIDDILR